MSIGYLNVAKECRLVHVPLGHPVPTPAAGYAISAKLFAEHGVDFYLEYREVKGDITSI